MPPISQDPPQASPATSSLRDYAYELPPGLIAQAPPVTRSAGRLLVVDGARRAHAAVRDLADWLEPGDRLVFNDTRVVPARLFGRKATGGRVEFMLERFDERGDAVARLRASKSPAPGTRIVLEAGGRPLAAEDHAPGSEPGSASTPEVEVEVEVVARADEFFVLRSSPPAALAQFLERHGEVPLPPYIDRAPDAADAERYQTVLARVPGAVAAPTAGLHFDRDMLDAFAARGIERSSVTLHVGAGTFQPIRVDDPSRHVMHPERLEVTRETVEEIRATRAAGGRVVAVGTTSVRALESAAAAGGGELAPFSGETRLFLRPGARFEVVDLLFTNFHLPESTLLMLVSAFGGLDDTLAAYYEAVRERYRFFSYGDAMLVFPTCLATGGREAELAARGRRP